jgi:hypothetical protein
MSKGILELKTYIEVLRQKALTADDKHLKNETGSEYLHGELNGTVTTCNKILDLIEEL